MENEQELPVAQVTDSNVPDIQVADKFKSQEFNRVKEQEPIEKLADAMEAKSEHKDEPTQSELPDTDSDKSEKVPPKETFDIEKWDGKVEALPEKLRKIVTDNQAAYTAKAQEAARYKQELERLNKPPQQPNQPLFTVEEYEEAQLNPQKFLELTQKIASKEIERAKAELMPVVDKIQYEQTVAQNEKMINDFATKNEDFWDLYETGIMQPLIDKFKNLEEPYRMVKEFQNKLADQEKNKAQGRVKEKKNASTFSRSTNQTENVVYINGTKEDVLRKQIEFAMQGKKVQVKLKN